MLGVRFTALGAVREAGFASAPLDAVDAAGLLLTADARMYADKAGKEVVRQSAIH